MKMLVQGHSPLGYRIEKLFPITASTSGPINTRRPETRQYQPAKIS